MSDIPRRELVAPKRPIGSRLGPRKEVPRQRERVGRGNLGIGVAPLLLLMHVRDPLDTLAGWFGGVAAFHRANDVLLLVVPRVPGAVMPNLEAWRWLESRQDAIA